MKRILVIKLGALGDFIQATAAFSDIRAHHKNAHITLLTMPNMLPLAEKNSTFDEIKIDKRRKFWNLNYLFKLHLQLKNYDFIYDLQTNDRTKLYYFLAGRPKWNGVAPGCSHPHNNPDRDNMHSLDRITDQLSCANISNSHQPDITYAANDISNIITTHSLESGKYIVLVPGGAPHRPGKRWPAEHFITLAHQLRRTGQKIILVGTKSEEKILTQISEESKVINLCGKTNIGQLISLFEGCSYAIGNDTGPMHLAAASGATGVALFGSESNPDLCAPRTATMSILQTDNIASISPQNVLEALKLKP